MLMDKLTPQLQEKYDVLLLNLQKRQKAGADPEVIDLELRNLIERSVIKVAAKYGFKKRWPKMQKDLVQWFAALDLLHETIYKTYDDE
jgi:hypothetical protein